MDAKISLIFLLIPVRIRSDSTPDGSRIRDIGEERLRGIVTRLPGRGLTPADSSTPSENAPPPVNPDVSAVLLPIQLELRYKKISFNIL